MYLFVAKKKANKSAETNSKLMEDLQQKAEIFSQAKKSKSGKPAKAAQQKGTAEKGKPKKPRKRVIEEG